jgi:hypothetical protein
MFERRLSQSVDATTLRGKLLFSVNLTPAATPINLITLQANAFGARSVAFAAIFTQWKIKRLIMKFSSSVGSTTTGAAVGVYDDVAATADIPTTLGDVMQLRSSAASLPGDTVPTSFIYEPVDKSLWHFCVTDSQDSRLTTYGVMYGATVTGTGLLAIEIDFELVYKGAADIS